MSIFYEEILPKINEISNSYVKNFEDAFENAFDRFDKYSEEVKNDKSRTRERFQKDKLAGITLQSINEVEAPADQESPKSERSDATSDRSSGSSGRASKKRSKNEVDGILSPEQDKRPKRNASAKAQTIITKQVNVNLTQKLRREKSLDKNLKSRRRKDDNQEIDKENTEPNLIVPVAQIKLEKLSIPPEPMDTETLPFNSEIQLEVNKVENVMPPPSAPVPKPRKGLKKDKIEEAGTKEESSSNTRRSTRTRKQNEAMPPPPVPSTRSTRASNRNRNTEAEDIPPEPRPKRTRAKKKVSEASANDDKKSQSSQESTSAVSSPADKRPKKTRRNQKATEQTEPPKEKEPEIISPKKERISEPQTIPNSPILLPKTTTNKGKNTQIDCLTNTEISTEETVQNNTITNPQRETKNSRKPNKHDKDNQKDDTKSKHTKDAVEKDKNTRIDSNTKDRYSKNDDDEVNDMTDGKNDKVDDNEVVSKCSDMDKTVVLPNGVYNHAPVTPKAMSSIMNATVVLEKVSRETIVIEKIMDATVVLDKGPIGGNNITEDNSLISDDSDYHDAQTPPKSQIPTNEPKSAVKEKVQQFEEMASRVTRTKTRAMAKKDDEQQESQTPPDKIIKPILSAETLNKMNTLIFNGKPPMISVSASKPRAIPIKSHVPSSASKLTANRTTDIDDRSRMEDPRLKKEAMLEAKRETQRRKREEKMAAAAAAREAAERERLAAVESATREKNNKMAHAQAGKMARLKEIDRKKQELARKVAETEERRKAEEAARLARLADEQRKAEAQRRKQLEEQLQMKKEEARMAREIEKKQKEYIEKQKLKKIMEDKCLTPLRMGKVGFGHPPIEPVYMQDGFQFLNSDEEDDQPPRPVPAWSSSKVRREQLQIQSRITQSHVDKLFSVRVHTPDLTEIFPNIERSRLKRTSSAVWRTPPPLPPLRE